MNVDAASGPLRLSDIGEKVLIRDFIKPLFNRNDHPGGVGDDCAMIALGDEVVLISTDRVPSDLIPFRLGIIGYHGLGDYLARLNLSDIAACGGVPMGLLLNLGLPPDILYSDVQALCKGFESCAKRFNVSVLGGDVTSACEVSISATAVGKSARDKVLTRRGALPGDSIFLSRPLGMAPAALGGILRGWELGLSLEEQKILRRQFTEMEPMFALGQALVESGQCGACMDNTDGIGQSLSELSQASGVAFVIERSALRVPPIVDAISQKAKLDPLSIVFNGGADLSLVGTLRGEWSSKRASVQFDSPMEIIGRVESGTDLWIEGQGREPLVFQGWNYFRE